MYNIDFNKLIAFNVPEFMWRPTHLRWLQLLVSQVKLLYNDFINWKNLNAYNAAHSGQVISIEHILNDIFDKIYRRIYIDDGARVLQNFIYNTPEDSDDVFIFNSSETSDPQFYCFNNQEDVDASYDFKVMVPGSLVFNENRMKALVNVYVIAGKSYKIITY